jgi:hypothetical protein
MSAATDALSLALTDLLTQLGKDYSFGGTAFRAVSNPQSGSDEYGRGYGAGQHWDTELTVDPGVPAFTSGLPGKGSVITQTGNSRKFTVVGTEHDDGDHVAYVRCTKLTA